MLKPRKERMTKKEVEREFKFTHRKWLKDHNDDIPAKSEAWHNYTDMLCKDGLITTWQYENWDTPLFINSRGKRG